MSTRPSSTVSYKQGMRQPARAPSRTEVASSSPIVFIVDPDDESRQALQKTIGARHVTRAFASVSAFFAEHDPDIHGCIVIETSGSETESSATLARMVAADCGLPLIFVSARASISTTVRALRAGAVNFLTLPVGADVLLAAVKEALTLDAIQHESVDRHRAAIKRLSALTARERQVLDCLVGGMLNKQIAADLGIVENTVKAHRARIMQKLAVRSLAELVLFVSTTDPTVAPPHRLLEFRNVR